MEILQVISNLKSSSGGPPRVVIGLSKELVKQGHNVSVYTTNLSDSNNLDISKNSLVDVDGVKFYYFNYGIIKRNPISPSLIIQLNKSLDKFDIVHIHGIYQPLSIITAAYCYKKNIPYVITTHGALDPHSREKGKIKKFIYHKFFLNSVINKASTVHYSALDEKLKAHEALGYQSCSKVIPLGIDLEEFDELPYKGKFRSKYPELKNYRMILFLGRITPRKGLDILTKAFAKVTKDFPDLMLVFVGPEDEDFGNQVRIWLDNEGILNKAIFTGMLLGEQKLSAYVDADIFVLPSYQENFGLVLAEAMACKLPIITTNQVNIWKEIQEANAGKIINCDEFELYSQLKLLLENPDMRKKMGKKGRELVERKFNWEKVGGKFIHLYNDLLK